MTAIRLDQSCPPVVLTVFRGRQTDPELDTYIEEMNAMYRRGRRYIGCSFMLDYAPDPRHLRRIAEWTRATKPMVSSLCIASAIVAPSAGFRFVMSTLLMIQPLPVRYEVVGDVDEAITWMAAELTRAKAPTPPRLAEYLRAQMRIERP